MILMYYNSTLESFTASIINLTTNVSLDETFTYNWKLNGVDVGATSAINLTDLNVGDELRLVIEKGEQYTGEYVLYTHFGDELTEYYSLSSDEDINHI